MKVKMSQRTHLMSIVQAERHPRCIDRRLPHRFPWQRRRPKEQRNVCQLVFIERGENQTQCQARQHGVCVCEKEEEEGECTHESKENSQLRFPLCLAHCNKFSAFEENLKSNGGSLTGRGDTMSRQSVVDEHCPDPVRYLQS